MHSRSQIVLIVNAKLTEKTGISSVTPYNTTLLFLQGATRYKGTTKLGGSQYKIDSKLGVGLLFSQIGEGVVIN